MVFWGFQEYFGYFVDTFSNLMFRRFFFFFNRFYGFYYPERKEGFWVHEKEVLV